MLIPFLQRKPPACSSRCSSFSTHRRSTPSTRYSQSRVTDYSYAYNRHRLLCPFPTGFTQYSESSFASPSSTSRLPSGPRHARSSGQYSHQRRAGRCAPRSAARKTTHGSTSASSGSGRAHPPTPACRCRASHRPWPQWSIS